MKNLYNPALELQVFNLAVAFWLAELWMLLWERKQVKATAHTMQLSHKSAIHPN